MKTVIIAADLSIDSLYRERAISLYSILDNSKQVKPYFYDPNSEKVEKNNLRFSQSINLTKDAIIVLFKEIKNFHEIDKTNLLVYIAAEPKIDQFMTFVLPRVDRVLAYDFTSCYHVASTLKKLSLETPVHKLQPYFNLNVKQHFIDRNPQIKIGINGDHKITYAIVRSNKDYDITLKGTGPAMHGWKLTDQELKIEDFDVYIHLTDKDQQKVQNAMAAGVIPICLNQSPYNEWIVNGINGFIVSSEMELSERLNFLSDKTNLLAFQKQLVQAIRNTISKELWVSMFLNTIKGVNVENINKEELFKQIDLDNFKWIVPRVIFDSGKEVYVPRKYNKSKFLSVKLNGIEEILKFFLTQKFNEVYIFDFNYEELEDETVLKSVSSLVSSYGNRLLNLFIVSDKPTPKKYEQLFSKMTKLSVQDGLNRIS